MTTLHPGPETPGNKSRTPQADPIIRLRQAINMEFCVLHFFTRSGRHLHGLWWGQEIILHLRLFSFLPGKYPSIRLTATPRWGPRAIAFLWYSVRRGEVTATLRDQVGWHKNKSAKTVTCKLRNDFMQAWFRYR